MRSKKLIVIIPIVVAVVISSYFAWTEYSIERPWIGLSCEEMRDLAMNPGHQSFSEKQHIEFHKDLERCMMSTEGHMMP